MAKVQFAEFAVVSSHKVRMFGEIARSHVQGSLFSRHNLSSDAHHPSSQPKMSVALNPSTSLGFHRPLTQLVKRSLTISNNNALPIAFKVKTTAPKLYCVRPNSGRVEPGQSVEVAVMLQAMREEPPLNAKCKDKFLIQSTMITPEKEGMSLQDIWSVPEGTDEASKVHQQKLRVTYLPPEGSPMPEETEPAAAPHIPDPASRLASQQSKFEVVNGHHEQPTSDFTEDHHAQHPPTPRQVSLPQDLPRSSTPHYEYSIAREQSHEHEEQVPIEAVPSQTRVPPPVTRHARHGSTDEAGRTEFRPEAPPSYFGEPEPAHAPVPAPPIPVPPPTTNRRTSQPPPPAAPVVRQQDVETIPAYRELVTQYNAAISEIEHLRNELATASSIVAESELRRRTKAQSEVGSIASETDVQTVIDDGGYHQEGVPLQVVVIIAVGIFITTYLFF
ncbi:hypothetical protein AMATHDRAFT_83601 [Amanita thiersii Skay4041]|uniref:MSP domain-containing protein n=1 Tax=Amanita thiersii Skay4041 TaxID=703135 RepID=A0A2A9NU76_9AGAR|nr:hypothetical protein AMATHDRAFT_83601 [Amanita thiersii Skay4041]